MASTPLLYCNSSLLHDLLVTETAFFGKYRCYYSWNSSSLLLEEKIKNVSCCLSMAQRISGSCTNMTSLVYSILSISEEEQTKRGEALNIELRIFSSKCSALESAGMKCR